MEFFFPFLDGDVLWGYEAKLFCTEEMGVLLGKFGWSDYENKGGVVSLERRGPPRGAHCCRVARSVSEEQAIPGGIKKWHTCLCL